MLKEELLDIANEIIKTKSEKQNIEVKAANGEVWCISKHLLATCMRLMEVGTKALSAGKKDEAYMFFEYRFADQSDFHKLC